MSKYTEPGLSPEERAREVLRGTIGGPTVTVVAAAIRAAVVQERRRCEGIAKEVGATMPPWPTSTKVAAEIATRIAGETKGGDEMRMDHTEAYRSAVEKLRRAMYVNAAPFNLSYALTQIDEDAPLTFPAWMVWELFAVHEAAGTPMDLHAT